MSFSLLGWLFAFGVLIHNTEEALYLPAWSARTIRWKFRVGAAPFRFAVSILSLAAFLAAFLASIGGAHSIGAYFLTGYALAMVLNVIFPHVAATIALRSYAPGTATAVLFNLPIGSWLVYRALTEGYVEQSAFIISGPLTVLAIVVSIPILFVAGKILIRFSSKMH